MAVKARKLNVRLRDRLKGEAAKRFIDTKLRAAEAKAADKFIDAFMKIYEDVVSKDIAIVEQYTGASLVSEIKIVPEWVSKKADRTFTHADGTEVVRSGTENLRLEHVKINEYANIGAFAISDTNRQMGFDCRTAKTVDKFYNYSLTIALPYAIKLYDKRFKLINKDEKITLNRFTFEYHSGNKTFESLTPLIIKYLEAAKKRTDTETELLEAIFTAINGAQSFEALVSIWPEAADLEAELYPESPAATALSVMNEEKMALICGNMKSRGVKSTACDIAA